MQSYNDIQKLVQSVPVDLQDQPDIEKKKKRAEKKGAVKHVIGKLPVKGQVVMIDGLRFRVEFADYVRGRLTVKMVEV